MQRFIMCFFIFISVHISVYSSSSFSGLPYYLQVQEVEPILEHDFQNEKVMKVCYKFLTSVPHVEYMTITANMLKNFGVLSEHDGFDYHLDIFGLKLKATLKSPKVPFQLDDIVFFNSAVFHNFKNAKARQLLSWDLSNEEHDDSQSEVVTLCEVLAFPALLEESYVRSLFRGPGPIGHFAGSVSFSLNVLVPLLFSELSLGSSKRDFEVPIFGMGDLDENDRQLIRLSHYVNSFNILGMQEKDQAFDEKSENYFIMLKNIENLYNMSIAIPLEARSLLQIFHRAAGL